MKVYLDTSFVVSLYSLDVNSSDAASLMAGSPREYMLSAFAELETINALELRVFRKQISAAQAKQSRAQLADDVRSGVLGLRALPESAFERAQELAVQTTARLGTRTADLLHVAAALEMKADYLYSFDQQRRKLAQASRLKVRP